MKITLRNPERRDWMSGYGVINRALAPICDSLGDLSADIHFFVSPPYSFEPVDPSKFNVGLTMGERDNLNSYKWANGRFPELANRMDLIITVSPWNHQVMKKNGIKCIIEHTNLGHDHDSWACTVADRPNRKALILDRGRDHGGGQNVLAQHLEFINYLDCKTPKPTSDGNREIIKKGRFSRKELQAAYREADVFFKWGREGWGFPILEAMSAGCLVITNCVHLPYLENNVNCLTFRNVDQLQHALRHAVRANYTEIKRAGQQTARKLTWDKARESVLALIRQHARRKA